MNQGPDISGFAMACAFVLCGVGTFALILGVLAGADALFTHLRWLP